MDGNTDEGHICEKDEAICNACDTQLTEDENKHGFRNLLLAVLCLLSSIVTIYFINNPYGNYIPILLIVLFEWYRSFPREKRSYYGLCRLLLCVLVISLWIVFILKFIIQSIALLFGYRHIPIDKVQHLFPYALILTNYARTKHDMDLNDVRRYIIHVLYDIPAFSLVIVFKLLNHPLNSLYSQITTYCYLGCLPIASDVETLNNIGIRYVVNMCAEYKGPRKTYEKYHINQLHLPTIDGTSPSVETIEKAIQFMNEAYINHQKIFVHCKVGMGRSAAIVLCHLVANEKMLPENALKLLKEKRPEITPSIIKFGPVKYFFASLKNNVT